MLPGDGFTTTLTAAPAGAAPTVGIRDSAGAWVLAQTAVGVTEAPSATAGLSDYAATLVAPTAGTYETVWLLDGNEYPEALVVDPSTTDAFPWAPTVEEVAGVTPAYTRGGFDDDRGDEVLPAGAEQGTYTERTDPTRTYVEGMIASACGTVAGRAGAPIPVDRYDLARSAAKWFTAAMISAGKMPAGTDDASGEYRSHIGNFAADMARLIELMKMGPTRLA